MWGRFDLPAPDARRLLVRQAAWTSATTLGYGAAAALGAPPDTPLGYGILWGLAVVATRPARVHALPLVLAFVIAGTLLLGAVGCPAPLAAAIVAGIAVGTGGALTRLEAVLASVAGTALGIGIAEALLPAGLAWWSSLIVGCIVGLFAASALLPGALHFVAVSRIPSPTAISRTLGEAYRAPCMRAWQLDQELPTAAPDTITRDGLAEVAAWVYRLGLSLQTLDQDVARIDPAAITQRQAALRADEETDSFVRERKLGTAQHLARMLEHRAVMVNERARTAALQEYALAYLEEARTGLAVARVLPGEATPERLGVVLERLRSHAADQGARRASARELEHVGG